MVRAKQASLAATQLSSPQVFELWGDSPIFPGPAWRLAWLLEEPDQRMVNEALASGRLWNTLRAGFPGLADLPDPWQPANRLGDQGKSLSLRAIAALAEALLQPAPLEICAPFVPVKLQPACLVLRCDQHELAGSALNLAATLTWSAHLAGIGARVNLPGLRQTLTELMRKVRICCDHPLTAAQLAEARRRGIPAFLLDPGQRLYQLGTGCHSRWISSTSNDHDSAFGVAIAHDKSKTHELLRQLGLPVPTEICLPSDVSHVQLLAAVGRLGYPCVLKPRDGEQGRGVTANIANGEELLVALRTARGYTRKHLLLQKHIRGEDHRLNVSSGKLVFAVRRRPPAITGNGKDSVLELIELANVLRRKLRQSGAIAADIDPGDSEVLSYIARAGLQISSVPAAGHHIQLRGNANVSTGGLREELDLNAIHPMIQQQCVAIARSMRLENCGIDYISADISLAPEDCGGSYIEVNSMPQNATIRTSLLIDNLFPDRHPHSVPVTIVICDWNQMSTVEFERVMAKILQIRPGETIGIPSELRYQIWPLLTSVLRERVHVYSHPRELLLNYATSHAIYLTNAELALHRGLPLALAATVICKIPPSTLQPAAAWEMFIRRCNQAHS